MSYIPYPNNSPFDDVNGLYTTDTSLSAIRCIAHHINRAQRFSWICKYLAFDCTQKSNEPKENTWRMHRVISVMLQSSKMYQLRPFHLQSKPSTSPFSLPGLSLLSPLTCSISLTCNPHTVRPMCTFLPCTDSNLKFQAPNWTQLAEINFAFRCDFRPGANV